MRRIPKPLPAVLLLLIPLCVFAVENVYPLDDGYVRPWELMSEIREIAQINPEIASWKIIGTSGTDRLPIYAIKVSRNVSLTEDYDPKLLFVGSHQSEEVIGIEVVLNNARKTIESYGIDPLLTDIVDNYELWFVPTVDPEGFNLVNGGKCQFKRKNNTDTDWDGIFEPLEDGVDLNKNYPFNWENGDSSWKRSRYYKGETPASEPEVQAMMRLYESNQFIASLFYHSSVMGSYSERVFFPWRWDDDLSPDYFGMYRLARDVAAELPRDFEEGHYTIHTWNNFQNGYARDYIYSTFQTWALTIESGGNSPYGFGIIQPSDSLLQKHLDCHWNAYISFLKHCNDNLLILRFTDTSSEPYLDLPVAIEERSHPLVQPMLTNDSGYLFRLLEPGNFVLNVAGQAFDLKKRPGVTLREITLDAPRKEMNPTVFNTLRICTPPPFVPPYQGGERINPIDFFEFHPGTELKLVASPKRSAQTIHLKLHGNESDLPVRIRIKIFADMRRVLDRIIDYSGETLTVPLNRESSVENLRVFIEQLDIKPYRLYKWQCGMNWEQAVRFSHWEELDGRAIGVSIDYE